MARLLTERVGEKAYNHQGCLMEIIIYNHARDIVVKFEDKTQVSTRYKLFKEGETENPNSKNIK